MQTKTAARDLHHIWNSAAQFDDTLRIKPRMVPSLVKKQVGPTRFSRTVLFQRMSACEPVLFSGFRVRPRPSSSERRSFSPLEEIRSGMPRSTQARVRANGSERLAPLGKVLDRWIRSESAFGVTDLHYMGTRFDARMDTTGLNDFNLLPRGTDSFQSQDSLVISSTGAVTDSHSDDHSGSNHCFMGSKLWLMWDTLEGLEHGLEDVEHCAVYDRAAFDLAAFLALPSSRWTLVGPGQTIFVPANLTHKVITLQSYLGLGNFHAGLAGFVDLLMRWTRLRPVWASRSENHGRGTVEFITRRAIRKIEALKEASRSERFQWGVPQLRARLQQPDTHDETLDQNFGSSSPSNLKNFMRTARRALA